MAAKIGVVPVKQQNDEHDDDNDEKGGEDEWSDEEHQVPQITEAQEKPRSETKRSRGDSKTKDKKSHHHHHHKKDRADSHGEHKHRKRRGSKTSHSSVDTRQSVPAEDGENKGAFLWENPKTDL